MLTGIAGSLYSITLSFAVASVGFGFFRPGNVSAGAKKWELFYDFGAVSYAALLGLLTLEILLISPDIRLHALMATLAPWLKPLTAKRLIESRNCP